MLKFYGKPHELQNHLKALAEKYGKNQKAIAIYIMMQKECEDQNVEIRKPLL